jgi:hypothetical protein
MNMDDILSVWNIFGSAFGGGGGGGLAAVAAVNAELKVIFASR